MRTTALGFVFATIAALVTATPRPVFSQSAEAAEALQFVCDASDGVPILEAVTERGVLPLVRWERDRATAAGVTPDVTLDITGFRECREAAEQLELAARRGTLDYLTLGRVDGQLAICSVSDRRSGCNRINRVVVIGQMGRNAQTVMSQLFELDFIPPQSQCDIDEAVYVDVNQYLDRDPETPLSCQCYCGFCVCPR
ncbi:hypothetical protein CKA32_002299 [Geitlerinema sp. FC II]|nr:COP23 domain-containing protein [Geitlerinema sp. CS-897]PPT08163.1 hypothetical protein CKA32_002299 [Geitlerinema sp. FC II]